MLGCGHLSVGSSVSHEFEADGAKLFTPQDIMAIAVRLLVLVSEQLDLIWPKVLYNQPPEGDLFDAVPATH